MIGAAVAALCVAFLGSPEADDLAVSRQEARHVCEQVVRAADRHGAPAPLAVALAWYESRFSPRVRSPAGALGPLQVMPRWWCPSGKADGCDLYDAGGRALAAYLAKHKTPTAAVCAYHRTRAKPCPRGGDLWSRAVVAFARRLEVATLVD